MVGDTKFSIPGILSIFNIPNISAFRTRLNDELSLEKTAAFMRIQS